MHEVLQCLFEGGGGGGREDCGGDLPVHKGDVGDAEAPLPDEIAGGRVLGVQRCCLLPKLSDLVAVLDRCGRSLELAETVEDDPVPLEHGEVFLVVLHGLLDYCHGFVHLGLLHVLLLLLFREVVVRPCQSPAHVHVSFLVQFASFNHLLDLLVLPLLEEILQPFNELLLLLLLFAPQKVDPQQTHQTPRPPHPLPSILAPPSS
mmetsp:Transcript_42546/g.133977  ORF Transcript_42546/g.133977 Transcript_42546/m.133977 type:complete len:204 (-) Transcript_42546:235-846(-)